jgi:hypothetical protein
VSEKGGFGLKSEGLLIAENEKAKFWIGVLTQIKNRGAEDILYGRADVSSWRITRNLSADAGSALHCPHDKEFDKVCFLQRP